MTPRALARAAMVLVALAHTAVIQWIYVDYVSPKFAYQGMFAVDLPAGILAWQLVFGCLPGFFLPTEVRKPSEFQVLLLFVVVYVPSIVIGYHICRPEEWGTYSGYMALCCALLIALTQVGRLAPLRLPYAGVGPGPGKLMLALFCVGVYAALIGFYGLPDDIFDVAAIYLARADFKEKVQEAPGLLQYLYFWQGLVINPALIVIGLMRRRFVLALVGCALQYLLFAVTTLRSIALAIFLLAFLVWFFHKRRRWNGLQFMALILMGAAVGGVLMDIDGPLSIPSALFVQRWLTMQGQLSGAYLDFFTANQKIFFGDAILKGYVNYPYGDLSPGQVIGDLYLSMGHGPIDNAPANFWADAFSQVGFVGPVLATALAGLVLWVVDSVFRNLRFGLAIMLFGSCALSLPAQGAQTAILTGGVLPLIALGLLGRKYLIRVRSGSEIDRAYDLRP